MLKTFHFSVRLRDRNHYFLLKWESAHTSTTLYTVGPRNCLNIKSHALNYLILNLDIDECTIGADNCNFNAYCNNTLGSYTCECKKDFTGDGVNCDGKEEMFLKHVII
jgi:hypothetical protein